ncbi:MULTISPECIES: thiamine diphosphokinase [Fusobacterium]|jgi:thiamine pyrophosphokinase|uniref:Thiamine diphosphokinase n=1 Tax=Fusobacterium varium ATCC 27725 TaxID=469618 RepID=A0ABN5JCR4_FUSVA|nr:MULTISPECIES: thiamine diphosphokinase [Fusobacterium]AVQ29782.1 thiamine diphosphokinase [Fusobacterium varium ATCC 27725]EES65070.1 thiamine diphosphokinase [Fusobacterium varium ATCC 27725]MCF0170545.1 thiamine diphosphokinase [Fusobacterium varium]MCF2673057.1 thiamine diphosphokinase [Fusobacterium varium]MCI6032363.1 thiamine diphosphokinase [Fusobacterium varium]
MKTAYVFFNGQLEGSREFYIKLIDEKKGDIYCADGGANHLEALGIFPLEIWGDLDSVTKEIIEKYRNNNVRIKKFPKDKDYTDGELILQHISKLNYDEIIIIGGLGGRIDHLLTNLNLIFKFKNLKFVTEKERIFSIEKKAELTGLRGKTISFVPFSEKVEGLTLEGFKYPLNKYILHQGDSICMSNIAVDDICKVTFDTGKLMGIILNK